MTKRTWIWWRLPILAALAFAAAMASAAPEPARVNALALAEPAAGRLVLELSRRVDHKAFLLDEPMRLVVDLADATWSLGRAPATGGMVAGYRYGQADAQNARLVVDLAQPARVRRLGYDLAGPRERPRLVVELEPVTRLAFAAEAQPWVPSGNLLRSIAAAPTAAPPAAPAATPPAAAPAAVAPSAAGPPVATAPAATPAAAPAPSPSPPSAPPPSTPPRSAPGATPTAPNPPPALRAEPAPPPMIVAPAPAAPPAQTELAPARQAAALAARAPAPAPRAPPPRRPMVVLDPGHGGNDPGTIGVGAVHEKDVTLAMAREMRRVLEASGRYGVRLTRDADDFVPLRDRIARARAAGADAFVSVHADSINSVETRGASVYTLSDTASDAEAAALAQRENRADIIAGVDLSHESKDVASILIDLAQRETMNSSARLAHLLVAELGKDVRLLPTSPHRFAGFVVLKAPDVPSVLLELGYLSNRDDAALLRSAEHRRRVAQALLRALDAYFGAGGRSARGQG